MNKKRKRTSVPVPPKYGKDRLPLREYLNRPLTIDGHQVDDKQMADFLDWSFATGSTDFKRFWEEYTSAGFKTFSKADMEAARATRAEAAADFEEDYETAYESFLRMTEGDAYEAARLARAHAAAIYRKKLEARLGGK